MKRNTNQNLKLVLFFAVVLGIPTISVYFFGLLKAVLGILAILLIVTFINTVFAKNH